MTSDFVPRRDRSEVDRVVVLDVKAPERGSDDLVPAHLLAAWEAVYRDYISVSGHTTSPRDRQEMAELSARVAVTWRRLAEAPGVDWWLVAAFSTAAEAMEQQAQAWRPRGRWSS